MTSVSHDYTVLVVAGPAMNGWGTVGRGVVRIAAVGGVIERGGVVMRLAVCSRSLDVHACRVITWDTLIIDMSSAWGGGGGGNKRVTFSMVKRLVLVTN